MHRRCCPAPRSWWTPLALGLATGVLGACSVQTSLLISGDNGQAGAAAGAAGQAGAAVEPSVVAAIDERPIGGASLDGGTTGGGTYAQALKAGAVYIVSTVDELRARVSGDTAAVVLVAEGTYAFSGEPRTVSLCTQACDPATPLASQSIIATYCTNGEALFDANLDYATLRVGKNKTIIGLGKGAVLKNVSFELSGASNIILRNLTFQDIAPTISGEGTALELWPSDHVWVDHCTIRNVGRTYIHTVSTWDEESSNQALVTEAGYLTLTYNHFDGRVDGVCGQRNSRVVLTNRTAAVTLAYNWFDRSSRSSPLLFGPSTWAHLFNNYWSDIDYSGVVADCGAIGILQGNVFASTAGAICASSDDGTSWKFCSAGVYGKLYAPMDGTTDETNLLDASSTLVLNGQATDGTGIATPVRTSGHTFTITAPVAVGSKAEVYAFTLAVEPSGVAAAVKAGAGAGRLF